MSFDWLAESLRLTLFLQSEKQNNPNISLRDFTDFIPDSKQETHKPAYHYEERYNVDETRTLLLVNSVNRIDLILMPIEQPANTLVDMQNLVIGKLAESIEFFNDLGTRILVAKPEYVYSRIACGIITSFKVDNKIDGYNKIQELIPVKMDSEKSRDFSFRINNRIQIKVNEHDLEINRLSQWGVLEFVYVVGHNKQPVVSGHSCQANLDINTDGNTSLSFDNKSALEIYLKLSDYGKEILEKGIK